MSENLHHYNARLRHYARHLRNNSTKAEIRLWTELLRARKMRRYKFNRQRPISYFISDFYCPKLKLIIEVDGWTHEDESIREKDQLRQKHLEKLGYKVIRFHDWEIHEEIDLVKRKLEDKIDEIEKKIKFLKV